MATPAHSRSSRIAPPERRSDKRPWCSCSGDRGGSRPLADAPGSRFREPRPAPPLGLTLPPSTSGSRRSVVARPHRPTTSEGVISGRRRTTGPRITSSAGGAAITVTFRPTPTATAIVAAADPKRDIANPLTPAKLPQVVVPATVGVMSACLWSSRRFPCNRSPDSTSCPPWCSPACYRTCFTPIHLPFLSSHPVRRVV